MSGESEDGCRHAAVKGRIAKEAARHRLQQLHGREAIHRGVSDREQDIERAGDRAADQHRTQARRIVHGLTR